MSDHAILDYAKYSAGLATAAFGFTLIRFTGVTENSAQLLLAAACFFLVISIIFIFAAYSGLVTNLAEDDCERKKQRSKNIGRLGLAHFWSMSLALLFIAILQFMDIFVGLDRRPQSIKIDCLEPILRGWPVCQ